MADPHPDFLGKDFFAIITKAKDGVAPDALAAMLPAHLEHQVKLEKEGVLFAAGPLMAEDGSRRGLIVIRAGSYDEAKKIADTDPFHAEGLREYTVDKWTVNEGSYSVRFTYSDQNVTVE